MKLSERKKAILKSIVDNYIAGGDPVGSKVLSESSEFKLSSATIRNEMSELEEMGYLKQPHTSAGRVPTALGYRTYIDSLMERYALSMEELQVLDDLLSTKLGEFGAFMEEAGRAISDMTNYASFTVLNDSVSVVNRYETLYVDDYNFLLIMICREGIIRNRHVKVHEPVNKKMLAAVKTALNELFTDISAEEITLPIIMKFEEKLGRYKSISSTILRVICEMLGSYDCEKVHVDGVTKLFSYPEFFNIAKVQSVLGLLEERRKFTKLVKSAIPGHTSVFIGDDEQSDVSLPDTGFVFHPISIGNKVIGAIGVIGPKRMDYKKVIASLNYFAAGITDTLNENTLNENPINDNTDTTGENEYGRQKDNG
ncbi:MAG: heat-inducible transcriptional repressor HrcA [Eubacteriales bacterium]|nr:heat-inducible transcriptional repressor HrcA [Eubacteriales bacterium]MDD4421835.1 heat-inducible transcriptional repressor HrcA [Eubacteriales bacterium]HBR31659.1 heat-inducible transcription repressor HrcA [Clostridiales bacterium]